MSLNASPWDKRGAVDKRKVAIMPYNIGFPAHFRHLFIQFHQFSIQFRPEKLTAFKSKVQFRQIVIHIRFLSINFKISAFKFVNCHWNSYVSLLKWVRNVGSNSSFFRTYSLFCHSNSSSVIGPLRLGDEFDWTLWQKWRPIDEIVFPVLCSATVTDEFDLQLTKTSDNARNWMTMFQNWSTKDEVEMSIRTFQSVRDEVERTFKKI